MPDESTTDGREPEVRTREMIQTEYLQKRTDAGVSANTLIRHTPAGAMLEFKTLEEVLNFAKIMATAEGMVPKHLIGNPGACVGIILQSMQWGMPVYAVAQKSYIAREGQPISYESQLIHAVIERNAPLIGRLSVRYTGEGQAMICTVSGHLKGEDSPREWSSEPLARAKPSTNDKGYLKGSPLWDKKPKVQMFYDTSRDWARMYCPDVILGAYTRDEMVEFDVQARPTPVASPFDDDVAVGK